MKNPNSRFNRIKKALVSRWSSEDYPGGVPRFQLPLFMKDIVVFILLPVFAVMSYRAIERPQKQKKQTQQAPRDRLGSESKSQIIEFKIAGSGPGIIAKKSPGSLVRVKLLNVVETYSDASVHAQIVDAGLGRNLLGGTLIGDATPDSTFERINIVFHYAKDPNREAIAYSISARALGLDGTLGLVASKKEAFFTRAVLGSANGSTQNSQSYGSSTNLKDILFRALTAGFVQEFSSGSQVEKNRSQVLSLQPDTEFFAELTDFFPGGAK